VITFSDVQAGISAELIRDHCTVLATNQRSLREIGEAILLIGRAIGCPKEAEALLNDFKNGLEALRCSHACPRPRVYFEEWDDPLVSGIGWVTEAIELVGGQDIFSRPNAKASRERQVESAAVCAADPEIIFASWCGKPVNTDQIAGRDAWHKVPGIRAGDIHPLNSDDIFQPGPRILSGSPAGCMHRFAAGGSPLKVASPLSMSNRPPSSRRKRSSKHRIATYLKQRKIDCS
jgi:iron complex transport system substrate-binding protein